MKVRMIALPFNQQEERMGQDNERRIQQSNNSTGWFVGIIVALALLAIGYLVFSANSGPPGV